MDPLTHWTSPGEHHLDFLGTSPFSTRTPSYTRRIARIVEDVVGPERAAALHVLASHKAAYQLLRSLLVAAPTPTPHDRLSVAAETFAWLGFGALEFALGRSGGEVRGRALLESEVGSATGNGAPAPPGATFTAGFVAAANEVAYDLTPGSITAKRQEVTDAVTDGVFKLVPANDMFGTRGVVPMAAEDAMRPIAATEHGARVAAATQRLRANLRAIRPTEDGRLFGFGLPFVRAPEDAGNRVVFEMLSVLEQEKPEGVASLGVLLLDAARVDAFVAFGGLLQSETWEEIEAPPGDDPLAVVLGCVSAARASGHGSVGVESFEPGSTLVLVSPGCSGSLYGRLIAERPWPFVDPTLGGIGVAAMELAHCVEWAPTTSFGPVDADRVGAQNAFGVEQTHWVSRGDDCDRVIVRAL